MEGIGLGDFQIHPNRPLAELRSGLNMAFAAERRGDPFFALLCDPASLPRLDLMPALRRIEAPNLLMPQAWRAIPWPISGRQQLAIVFERPLGGRLTSALDAPIEPVSEDDVIRDFLTPIVPALRMLHAAGVVHGAVNPTNLFFRDEGRGQVVLGECVSNRAAALQPAAFAPIEMAMATPGARGLGQSADDVFGLGMVVAFLALGRNPAAGIDEKALLRARVDGGSYSALVSEHRLPVGLIELLRGLLADDAKVRWTMEEVEEWLPSRHVVTRQGLGPKRASRPFDFAGRAHVTARALMNAFAEDPTAAAAIIRGTDFEPWVQRALGDENSIRLLKSALNENASNGRSATGDGALVARVGIALDPLAPIRYRGVAAMPDGLGGALLDAVNKKGDLQIVAEVVAQRIPQFWLSMRTPIPPDLAMLLKQFDRLHLLLEDRRLGGGVERVLYELNPTLHCLSPLIEADHVVSMSDILPALERRAADDFGGVHPIDRHVAAFVATKLKTLANDWVDALSSNDPKEKLLGTLRLLMRLQGLGGAATVPMLTRWIAKHAAPFIEQFHHRPTRKHLAAQIEAAMQSGRLHDLFIAIDDPDLAQRDRHGFAEAKRAHESVAGALLRAEAAAEGPRRNRQIEELAGQLAASIASVLAAAAFLASMVVLS